MLDNQEFSDLLKRIEQAGILRVNPYAPTNSESAAPIRNDDTVRATPSTVIPPGANTPPADAATNRKLGGEPPCSTPAVSVLDKTAAPPGDTPAVSARAKTTELPSVVPTVLATASPTESPVGALAALLSTTPGKPPICKPTDSPAGAPAVPLPDKPATPSNRTPDTRSSGNSASPTSDAPSVSDKPSNRPPESEPVSAAQSMAASIQAELEALLENAHPKPPKTEASLEKVLTAPTSSGPPPDHADDQQLMRDILTQMKELTGEVKRFREKLDTGQPGHSDVLSAKPPGVLPNAVDQPVSEPPTEAPEPTAHANSRSSRKKKSKAVTLVSNLLFYFVVAAVVFGAFCIKSSKNGKPWSIAGYSAMTVLTGSMQDVYPQGSLIITKTVDADKLSVGDDITFMTGETSSITHRIIGITENYLGTGERGFETKGIMNQNADKDIVAAGNIVGRVVFCSLALGKTAKFITANWQLLLFFVLVLVGLIAFLQWNARRAEKDE